MSLDVTLMEVQPTDVFSANITHNLTEMAEDAGIYKHLWRPEEIGIKMAYELILPLRAGLALMKSDPDRFKRFDSPNGWGSYDDFVPWVEKYLVACQEHPNAEIRVSR
ncbi:hypothetical protein HQ520_14590 [bacterium]|nr:hypothetical protein [bacterium]